MAKEGMSDFSFDERSGCMKLTAPREFSFSEALMYLTRSAAECLHHVEDCKVYKLIMVEQSLYWLKLAEKWVSIGMWQVTF